MFEISKEFRFDAAHTLKRPKSAKIDAEASQRVHGHSYRAEVAVKGAADAETGMVMDLGLLERALEAARAELDHHFLDEVEGLGPATMENLSAWIWQKVAAACPGLVRVTVYRDSIGERCTYLGPEA